MKLKPEFAPDIDRDLKMLVDTLGFFHIENSRIIGMRSTGSKSRAIARIWSLPNIWQMALGTGPYYIIEVISERYDKLNREDQLRTLIHELLHVPKGFTGGLVPHKCFGKRIDKKRVEELYQEFLRRS